MYRKLLILSGSVLSVIGIGLVIFSRNQADQLIALDYWKDNGESSLGGGGGGVSYLCYILKEPELSRRVIAEQEGTALLLTIVPTPGCNVSIEAPSFIVSPEKNNYSFDDSDNRIGKEVSLAWALVAQRSGRFDIPVSVGDETKVLHLKVTDIFGLSPWQTEVAGWLIGFLGIPTLTLSGILTFIGNRKNRSRAEDSKQTNSGSSM